MSEDNVKSAIEALLFASEKPLLIEDFKKTLNLEGEQIRKTIELLKVEYEQLKRGIRVYEVAGGFRLISSPEFAPFLRKLYKGPKAERLSQPALETLAIIAYKQPVTRLEIELLRKVNIDGVISNLLAKNLVRIAGRKKAPGCPYLFATTRQFLEYFGLKSLEDLPKVESFSSPLTTGENQNELKESTPTN